MFLRFPHPAAAVVILVLIIFSASHSAGAVFGSSLELRELIEYVMLNNPVILAAEHGVEASLGASNAAGFWPDPTFTVSVSNLPGDFTLDRSPMSGIQLNLSQKVPFFGKTGLQKRIGRLDARVSALGLDETRRSIAAKVHRAWWAVYLLERHLEISRAHLEYLRFYEGIAQSRYATGLGSLHDVLKPQVEIVLLTDRLNELERRLSSARGEINLLMNRSPTEPLPPLGVAERLTLERSLEELQELALTGNPNVGRQETILEKREAGRELAHIGYFPDFMVGVGYRIRDEVAMDPVAGENFWSFSLGFNLPLFTANRQGYLVDSAEADLLVTEAKLTQLRNEIAQLVFDLYVRYETLLERLTYYEDGVLPLAEISLEAAVSGYTTGETDLLSLINSQRTLLDRELEYHRTLNEYHTVLADLEHLSGEGICVPKQP